MGHGKRKKSSSNDLIALPVSSPLTRSNAQQPSPVGSSSYQQRLEQLILRAAASSSSGTERGISQAVVTPGSPLAVGIADVGTSSQPRQPVLVSRATSTPEGASEEGNKGKSQFLSPRPSPLGRSPGRGGAELGRGSSAHLPPPRTIRRGQEPLRRISSHDSPAQRALGTAALTPKMEYQAKIATWAATRVPCLGALYGLRLMSTCRASGISSPLLNSHCERCSVVLVPGVNCSVRDAREVRKRLRRRAKTKDGGQAAEVGNTVVHVCLYCKHENKKLLASSKQHGKTRFAQAAPPAVVTTPIREGEPRVNRADPSSSSPFTPPAAAGTVSVTPGSSIDSVGQGPQSSGKKRKRKGWTSLKAVATTLHERGQASGNHSSTSSSTPSSVTGTRTLAEDFIKLSDNGGRSWGSISPVTPASNSATGKNKKRRSPTGLKNTSMPSLKF